MDGSFCSKTNFERVVWFFPTKPVTMLEVSFVTAECLAAPDAAQLAFGSKFPQVVLENDALQVVQNLGSMQMCSTPLGLIVEDIKSLLQNFGDVRVCHIRKNDNVIEYRLAKLD